LQAAAFGFSLGNKGLLDLKGYGWMLWEGLQLTLAVGVCALLLAMLMGLVGAWGKLSRNPVARTAAATYTTVIRGVPELLLLLIVYYGTPTLIQDVAEGFGHDIIIDVNPFIAGVMTLGFIYGAFSTEVFRGAILAVHKGQIEAAYAAGMSRAQMVRRILLPQVWRFALPGLGNVWDAQCLSWRRKHEAALHLLLRGVADLSQHHDCLNDRPAAHRGLGASWRAGVLRNGCGLEIPAKDARRRRAYG
jgi:His/Glu/Gln/Arg/opine family amino acid ABC transporter permease subunit